METSVINKTTLKTKSVLEFTKENGFTKISPVIYGNKNGYPFIVLENKHGETTMVYFSKNAAKLVAIGQPVTKQIFSDFRIAEDIKNAAGEERIKLVSGGSNLDIESLLGE